MRQLGSILAAICAVLFVISSLIVLLLFNIEAQAFSSGTYKQAFENQRLYERMPTILGTSLTTYIGESGISMPFLQVLTIEDWQNSISLLLPPEELKTMANQALDATFDYLNGRTNSAVISLAPLKAHLAGEAGIQLVLQILRRQPACTVEQLTQMALGLFGGQIALCNPPEQAIGLMMPFIQTQLQALTASLPDEVTFISDVSGTPDDPRLRLNAIRSAVKLTPFLPLLFLIGIAIFAVRSLVDWLTWWGWPLMFAGGINMLIALFGSPLIGGILGFIIRNQGAVFIPPVLASTIAETASAVARQMLTPVVIQGIILGIVGLGMVIAATLLTRSRAGLQPTI